MRHGLTKCAIHRSGCVAARVVFFAVPSLPKSQVKFLTETKLKGGEDRYPLHLTKLEDLHCPVPKHVVLKPSGAVSGWDKRAPRRGPVWPGHSHGSAVQRTVGAVIDSMQPPGCLWEGRDPGHTLGKTCLQVQCSCPLGTAQGNFTRSSGQRRRGFWVL